MYLEHSKAGHPKHLVLGSATIVVQSVRGCTGGTTGHDGLVCWYVVIVFRSVASSGEDCRLLYFYKHL